MYFKRARLAAASLLLAASSLAHAGKVLYVTHEPGRWHDYSAQLADFREVAADASWELTVATGDKDALFDFLRSENFAAGQDAIVYNFCLADSRDMAAMSNLIDQTVSGGVPAVLVHCAMHSWWDTFKKGKPIPGNPLDKARASKSLLKQWQQDHPNETMPAWGDFTGIASTKHGPKKPITLVAIAESPVALNIPDGYATRKTELYNNHYLTPDVVPLLRGIQRNNEEVVMWLAPRGEGQIIGLTLGHNDDEWDDPVFRELLKSAVDYLLEPQ
ncbi:ThuA domain-containing protein [Halioglobus maricola]|uniref:ThuA domain-containing protein n=1 Tax=Halioglobus maricola TaxID=2601894 RepID=UPI0014797528|nr:ThuA domain-containing protein [Halioglobus maricola]